jgi:type IV pilus assembly protein PilF
MRRKFLNVAAVLLLSSFIQSCTSVNSNINQNVASSDNVALGLAYLKNGNKIRAKEKLLRALHESPQNPVTLEAMAYFWEETGNTALASQYYAKAYELAPDDGTVLNNYAIFLCKQHHAPQAEILFLKAANLQNYINTAKAYENAGVCALTVNDKAKAKDYFTKALAN